MMPALSGLTWPTRCVVVLVFGCCLIFYLLRHVPEMCDANMYGSSGADAVCNETEPSVDKPNAFIIWRSLPNSAAGWNGTPNRMNRTMLAIECFEQQPHYFALLFLFFFSIILFVVYTYTDGRNGRFCWHSDFGHSPYRIHKSEKLG